MDGKDRLNCQVRFLDQNGTPVGCGFICADQLVMTCTHVVATCVDGPVEDAVVDCLVGGAPGHPAKLRVVKSFSTETDEIGQAYLLRDIALLKLEKDSSFPEGFTPISSRMKSVEAGLDFIGTGIKEGFLKGIQFDGKVGDFLENSRVFVSGSHSDNLLAPGCSGAAVFHKHDGFIGMVAEVQGLATGLIVPIEILREVCPIREGAQKVVGSETISAATTADPLNKRLLRALGNFDRAPQTMEFMNAFDRKWSKNRMAMLCAIAGLDVDVPHHCRDKFRKHDLVEFFRRNNIALNKVDAVEISWPTQERRFNVAAVFERMKSELADKFKAPGSDPAQIREALNNDLRQLVFYSKLDQRTLNRTGFELSDLRSLFSNPFGRRSFSGDQLELLKMWARYFCEIDDDAIDRPLIHFLIVTLDQKDFRPGTDEPNALLKAFYEDFLEAANSGLESHSSIEATSLLSHFEIDFIDIWLEENAGRIGLDEQAIETINESARKSFSDQSCIRLKDVENWMRSVAG